MSEQSPTPSTPTPTPTPTSTSTSTTTRFVPLLVFGIMLNTIGIALQLSTPAGYVLIAAGMLLILIGLVRMLAARAAAHAAGPGGDAPRR